MITFEIKGEILFDFPEQRKLALELKAIFKEDENIKNIFVIDSKIVIDEEYDAFDTETITTYFEKWASKLPDDKNNLIVDIQTKLGI